MAIQQRIDEVSYQRVVFAEPDRILELQDGRLREKPAMSWEHDEIAIMLGHYLLLQLDHSQYRVRVNSGRLRRPEATIFIPDVAVIPASYRDEVRVPRGTLAIFSGPLPFVVEVWSASTGDYDVDAKLPVYQQRGDLEIWCIHPYERTVTAWHRQPDGTYNETIFREGVVSLAALPGVTIDLDRLFEV
jgi:Uma2 family endonuclease